MSIKSAYNGTASSFGDINIADLIQAISKDYGINELEKLRLLAELKRMTGGASNYTPLSNFMYGAFGALFGNLIGKYFGMGTIGQLATTLIGGGIGSSMYNRMTGNTTQGWKSIV